jgi:predicted polyphosphate/ATP-dependent NAD kinase
MSPKKVGIIVNPVAGVGGKVGLKGSDGKEILELALKLGAIPESPVRAITALKKLIEIKNELDIYTYPGEMGEDELVALNLPATVIGTIKRGQTTASDTVRAAKEMLRLKVDMICFVGGDGTARNIVDAVGTEVPVLGVPAGCKIHSAVYAINPKVAGELLVRYLLGKVRELRDAEVMDIDEDAFRKGEVNAKLYGYLKIPNERVMMQNMKSGRGLSEETAINLVGNYLFDSMKPDVLYLVGPGSTTRGLMERLGLENTLLGVDVIYNFQLIANDVTEKQIIEIMEKYNKRKIIVTIIGGQGYIFGRGNQQISADVIKRVGKENIIIIATKDKIVSLIGKSLLVDTDEEETNEYLSGYYRVVVGYDEIVMFKVKG